ncbi:DUF4160 domain-containing protein [Pseudanabaena sp. PCC 6802]|uniref:DUF4160 domain-containing protein n=1 Tax=Pseudanabaena sp. PCC 6802 TaxID=118173 RepID=UPI000347DA32|nr:DUF4160 domain-containing protein [Pseudanabaena sp. PCC 6802]
MPKVLEDIKNNLFVYIYTNDHEPAHVHVFKGRKNDTNQTEAKINIGNETERPSVVVADETMSDKDIVKALKLVATNQEMLLHKWQEIHDISKLGKRTDRRESKGRDRKGEDRSKES